MLPMINYISHRRDIKCIWNLMATVTYSTITNYTKTWLNQLTNTQFQIVAEI